MRRVFLQPNYHAGGTEIVGHRPPGGVADTGGALKSAGFDDITFIDVMTNHNRWRHAASVVDEPEAGRGARPPTSP